MFCARCLRATVARRQLPFTRQFSSSLRFYSAAEPQLSTPTSDAGEAPKQAPASRSICPEGTVLNGLNYTKGGQDPVALKDEDYPEWLWSCLDVMKKTDAEDDNLGDEFCMSAAKHEILPEIKANVRLQQNPRSSENWRPSAKRPSKPSSSPKATSRPWRPRCRCSSSPSTSPASRTAACWTTLWRQRSGRSCARPCARRGGPRSRSRIT